MQIGHPGRGKAAQGKEVGQQERGSQLMKEFVSTILEERCADMSILDRAQCSYIRYL